MLVSSIARLNVHNTLNNSASTQNNNGISAHTFGGEHDLGMLNKIDNKFGLDLITNNLLYRINFLQEKFHKNHENRVKSLNILA